MTDSKDIVAEVLDVLYAIELLEYHNKNWLNAEIASNPAKWSLKKQNFIQLARNAQSYREYSIE